jgi:sulfate adenylyltransferase subunit 1
MDLVGFDEAVFERIRQEYLAFVSTRSIADLRFIPMSALPAIPSSSAAST